jgi:uncharacterized membrane-anchored protein
VRRAAALAVILLQIGLLVYMIVDREMIVLTGDTVYLRTAPVDPRDLFRGDYVRLEYEISVVPGNRMRGGLAAHAGEEGYPVYTVLKDGPEGIATLDYATDRKPAERRFIKGRIQKDWLLGPESRAIRVKYDIETYFVQQGRGRVIEDLRGRRGDVQVPLLMAVALCSEGDAVVKGHRWSPLGIGIEVLRPPTGDRGSPDAGPGPGSPTIRTTLQNAGEGPLALVMLPEDRSFVLRPVAGSKRHRRTRRSDTPPPLPADSDVVVLGPGEKQMVEIDLAQPPWHVTTGRGAVPIGNLPPAARFRLVYAPPDPAACSGLDGAGIIWHGDLPSRAFNGSGRID